MGRRPTNKKKRRPKKRYRPSAKYVRYRAVYENEKSEEKSGDVERNGKRARLTTTLEQYTTQEKLVVPRLRADGRVSAKDLQTKYALLSAAAYYQKNESSVQKFVNKHEAINGFVLDTELSSKKNSVFVNAQTNEVVISFKGTNPLNMEDLYDDAHIVTSMEYRTGRFKDADKLYKRVRDKYGADETKITTTGHSLGGAIAMFVGEKYGLETHSFNPGISIVRALQHHSRNENKSYIYRTSADPVSIGAYLNQDKNREIITVNQSSVFDPHGISNFYEPASKSTQVFHKVVPLLAQEYFLGDVKSALDMTNNVDRASHGISASDEGFAHALGLDKLANRFKSDDQIREDNFEFR